MNMDTSCAEYYDKQCGDVFMTVDGNLIVQCTLCETKLYRFLEYATHIKEDHILANYGITIRNCDIPFEDNEKATLVETVPENNFQLIDQFDDVEFLAPIPTNCKEIETFIASMEHKKEFSGNSSNSTRTDTEVILWPKFKPKRQSSKKYKCPQCDFVTKRNSAIHMHLRRHNGLRPYKCTQCSKAFYTPCDLKNHSRTHDRSRPYLCTICGHTCVTSFALWRHSKSCRNIRDHECKICGLKFVFKNGLSDHMATHSDVRAYTCSVCSSSFKLMKSLHTHMKIHLNKRQYECKHCPARFNQSPGLISHLKSRHSLVTKGNV